MVTFLNTSKGCGACGNIEPGHVVLLCKRGYHGKGDAHVVGRKARLRSLAVEPAEAAAALFIYRARTAHYIPGCQVGGKRVARCFERGLGGAGCGLTTDAVVEQTSATGNALVAVPNLAVVPPWWFCAQLSSGLSNRLVAKIAPPAHSQVAPGMSPTWWPRVAVLLPRFENRWLEGSLST